MIRELRIGQFKDIALGVLILGALCIFGFWKIGPGLLEVVKGAAPLREQDRLESKEGAYVSWEVLYPLQEYMETTKTTKIYGVSGKSKKNRSYWIVINRAQETCMSVEVSAKRYEEMEACADRLFEAWEKGVEPTEEGVSVSGSLERLQGEDLYYFNRTLARLGLPEEDIVYHLRDGVVCGESKTNIYGLSGIYIIVLLILLFIVYTTFSNSAVKGVRAYLAEHPKTSMAQLESDFATAVKINGIWVGKSWTFSSKLKKLILENSQIIWVHTGSVRSGRNINFYVWWEMLDGSQNRVSVSSEKKCSEILKHYDSFSHIVTGNNLEYEHLLRNDREAFLNLKYRSSLEH